MSEQSTISIAPELLGEFIDEALDGLAAIPDMLVRLEQNPSDLEIVQAVFRPVHSLKGNSAFFDLAKTALLAHELETLLDLVRKSVLKIDSNLISALLAGVDLLSEMLARVKAGKTELESGDQESGFINLIDSAKKICQTAKTDDPQQVWALIFNELADIRKSIPKELAEVKARIDNVLCSLEPLRGKNSTEGEKNEKQWKKFGKPLGKIFEMLADPLEQSLPDAKARDILKLLQEVVELTENNSPEEAATQEAIEICGLFMNTSGFDEICRQNLLDKLGEIGIKDRRAENSLAETAETPEADEEGSQKNADAAAKTPLSRGPMKKTMRVAETHIDTFLAYVGEFLVVRDMFANLGRKITSHISDKTILYEFRRANETFALLSNNLQNSIMDVRKVSVKPLLQKVTRIVRDVANGSGKEISVSLDGNEVEIDKSLIDLLDAPLVHIVRNAADHGIELPEEREKIGKNRAGRIHVKVSEDEDSLIMEITDDGKGLDFASIRAKAEAMGIISTDEFAQDDEISNVIFLSGLSTAEKITEISGRGVGLDVAKRMVEDAGGTISVESVKGKGCSFSITLSKAVTTQIMSAYLIGIEGQSFILPLDKIGETCVANIDEIKTVNDANRCFVRNNEVIPLLPLKQELGFGGNGNKPDRIIIVTVRSKTRRVGLIVDEVRGVQQVVLRQIDGMESSKWIQEAALLGDGSVALMLDVDRLATGSEVFNNGT